MARTRLILLVVAGVLVPMSARAQEITLESAPPVVVKTVPEAGSGDADPAATEIRVTFSKPMRDGSWSWSTASPQTFPQTTGEPKYLEDGRTCVLPVKLEPGRTYAIWLNSQRFRNFKDEHDRPAVPYLLVFQTRQ
jgi:hypothetical protein